MKKILFWLVIGAVLLMNAQAQTITPALQAVLNDASPSDMIPVTIKMSDQYDVSSFERVLEDMTREERRIYVVSELKSFSNNSQQSIMNAVSSLEAAGSVMSVYPFWMINMIACKAKPAAINQLAQRQDVYIIHIDEDYDYGELEPVSSAIPANTPEIPYHITQMNVPQAWDRGYKGEDVVVAVLDHGVNYNHHDLIDNMWEHPDFPNHGYNFIPGSPDSLDPMDNHDEHHGTFVAGIIAGNGLGSGFGEEYPTGVAPKAKIMAIKVLDQTISMNHSVVMAGVQFAIEYGADILNLSLGSPIQATNVETIALWRQTMDIVLLTERLAVVAAGNFEASQNPPNQIFVPGNVPPPWRHPDQIALGGTSAVVTVGATNATDELWSRSSNGPVTWQTIEGYNDYPIDPSQGWSGLIRPDVVAPGVEILSLINPVGYGVGQGTSMSAAAVSGVMALLLSVNPFLLPVELDEIIETTALQIEGHTNKNNETGSGRVDALAAVQMAECVHEVYNNQVLNISISTCDIIVKPGATLTINQNLFFLRNKKIVVEPGGKLIVDGALITGYNDAVWQGIQVWGNRQAHQWPDAQGNLAQGYLELNNALIENAIDAVSLWKPGDYATTGGIVVANDAFFRNNKKAVHALHYHNYNPATGQEMDYRALFTNCNFIVDGDYIVEDAFSKHVDLNNVKGVKFTACNFHLTPDAPNVSAWNMGIGAYSAGFHVNAKCNNSTIPCNDWQNGTFNGFTYGINATGDHMNTNTYLVSRAHFTNNAYGIRNLGVNNFAVLHSEFHLGYNEKEKDPCDSEGKSASSYGIHMTGCTGFAIEENYFTKASGAPQGNYTGILCKDSETEHDVIYRNIFNGLSYGNFAEGNNRLFNDDLVGLEYQCNFNTGNNRDFIVTGNDPNKPPQIRGYQGSMSREAGNTFSTGVQLPDGHFKNTGTQVINYCYNTNPPVYYTPFYVMPIPNAGVNTCPSNYGGGSGGSTRGVVLTEDEKQEAELAFANNLSDFNNVKALYNNLKDGGNTQALKTEVETAWPSDMWELRSELLGKSPHLSKEVLMAAADKTDVLPESILFEILSANPDELRKEELISHLENKDQPLPAYMISILRQLAGGVTYKTILQQDMARYFAGKTQAAYMLIRSCLNDTVSDYDYLRTWLNNLDNLNADMQIVAAYLAEENYTAAQAMLNLIPATRNLEGNALADYNDYKTMMEMQMAWTQQNRSIFELDSLEVAILLDFAENTNGKAALMARGILEYAYGYHFCNCLPVDDPAAWKSTAMMPGSAVDNGLSIQAVPNPASTWVAFNFTLPVHVNEAVLQITDVHGRSITSFVITSKQGQQVWDIRDVKKGIYLYTLKAGTMSKNGKLIIN